MNGKRWLGCIFSLVVFGCVAWADDFPILDGPYLGQPPPGGEAQHFAAGIVGPEQCVFNATFAPDGREFYYSVKEASGRETIKVMRWLDGQWRAPENAPFVSRHNDCDPFFSADGRRLWFISTRPLEESGAAKDWDIWYVERTADGWTAAVNAGPPVNSPQNEYYVSLTRDGTIYFASERPGGHGSFDIYRAEWQQDHFTAPENLGPAVNSDRLEHDPYVAPDESWIIFTSVDRPGGCGAGDLYISHRRPDGTWTAARHLGPAFNTPGYEFCANASPDGQYFFFTRSGNLFWVAMTAVLDRRTE